ncbi:hypothetical protein LTR48_008466, partial [Friedmanniomyces endolithicus]
CRVVHMAPSPAIVLQRTAHRREQCPTLLESDAAMRSTAASTANQPVDTTSLKVTSSSAPLLGTKHVKPRRMSTTSASAMRFDCIPRRSD